MSCVHQLHGLGRFGMSTASPTSLGFQCWKFFNTFKSSLNFFHFSPQETKIKFVVRDNFYNAVLPAYNSEL